MKKCLLACLVFISCCHNAEYQRGNPYKAECTVLTVNERVVEGNLSGFFLSSPSGYLKTDKIIVGLQLNFKKVKFLFDSEFSHAQLAYYKGKEKIPVRIVFNYIGGDGAMMNVSLDDSIIGSEIYYKYVEKSELKRIFPEIYE